MAAMSKGKANTSPRIENRRAWHEYFIEAKLECGIALLGSEVKSLRDGKAQLQDSFAKVERGQLFLHNCHIDPYSKSAIVYNHEPLRSRKLLMHKREIQRLIGAVEQKGHTLVPLELHFRGSRVKVVIALARGKKEHDKRADLKKREADREVARVLRRR